MAGKQQAGPQVGPLAPAEASARSAIAELSASAQSILAPDALTISAHLARSAFTVARNCSSVSLRTDVPMPASFSRRAGFSCALRTAALMRSAILASSPLGAIRPYQVTLSKPGSAGLVDGRHVGEDADARLGADAQQPHLAGPPLAEHGLHLGEAAADLARHHGLDGLGAALVGHVHHVEAGDGIELGEAQVRAGAVAGRAVVELAGRRLHRGDELLAPILASITVGLTVSTLGTSASGAIGVKSASTSKGSFL